MCTLVIEIPPYYALQLKKKHLIYFIRTRVLPACVCARAHVHSTCVVLVGVRGCQVPWNWRYRQL